MKHQSVNYGIVLLAAGASERLKQPKQLLPFRSGSLLSHLISQALSSKASPIIVVLGANAALVREEITSSDVSIVENTEWSEGMASSIRCGIRALIEHGCEAGIIMTCDQPHVSPALLDQLIQVHFQKKSWIVISDYGTVTGPPVLFDKTLFPDLLELKGDTGARKLVGKHAGKLSTVPFPTGVFDIDTAADYNDWLRSV